MGIIIPAGQNSRSPRKRIWIRSDPGAGGCPLYRKRHLSDHIGAQPPGSGEKNLGFAGDPGHALGDKSRPLFMPGMV